MYQAVVGTLYENNLTLLSLVSENTAFLKSYDNMNVVSIFCYWVFRAKFIYLKF